MDRAVRHACNAIVVLSIVLGVRAVLFGTWLTLPFDTFDLRSFAAMRELWPDEKVWGVGYITVGMLLSMSHWLPLTLTRVVTTIGFGAFGFLALMFGLSNLSSTQMPGSTLDMLVCGWLVLHSFAVDHAQPD